MDRGFEHWILAKTQAHREDWAAENVARQGYQYYLPKLAARIPRGDSKHQGLLTAKPLFPRYLFVLVRGEWSFLLSTFGVSGVVLNGDSPAVVPDRVIDDIQEREDVNGHVILPSRHKYEVDERVRVTRGPFKKKTGIFKGSSAGEREEVLLDFLGGKRTVLIESSDLEPY